MRIIRYHTPVFRSIPNAPSLRDEIDRLFDAAFSTPFRSSRFGAFRQEEFPLDLFEEKGSFVVRAELPGFRKEDLSLEVADGTLTVTAHHKVEKSAEGAKESTVQTPTPEHRLSRSLALPEQVKVEAIGAKYENGVLTVTLPKQEEAKPQQIKIDVK